MKSNGKPGKPRRDAAASKSADPTGRQGPAARGADGPHRLSQEVRTILQEEALFSGAVLPRAGVTADGDEPAKAPRKTRSSAVARDRPSRGWFRLGFALSALTATLLAVAYRHGTRLADDIPWAGPQLSDLAGHVNRGRVLAEDHFGWIPVLVSSLPGLSGG